MAMISLPHNNIVRIRRDKRKAKGTREDCINNRLGAMKPRMQAVPAAPLAKSVAAAPGLRAAGICNPV